MNYNRISTNGFSNRESSLLYRQEWPNEPKLRQQYLRGDQCGGCSYFAPLNEDWGICCCRKSRHHLETVFEHFIRPAYVGEGWGPHSFSNSMRCECHGVDASETKRQTAKRRRGSTFWSRSSRSPNGLGPAFVNHVGRVIRASVESAAGRLARGAMTARWMGASVPARTLTPGMSATSRKAKRAARKKAQTCKHHQDRLGFHVKTLTAIRCVRKPPCLPAAPFSQIVADLPVQFGVDAFKLGHCFLTD